MIAMANVTPRTPVVPSPFSPDYLWVALVSNTLSGSTSMNIIASEDADELRMFVDVTPGLSICTMERLENNDCRFRMEDGRHNLMFRNENASIAVIIEVENHRISNIEVDSAIVGDFSTFNN